MKLGNRQTRTHSPSQRDRPFFGPTGASRRASAAFFQPKLRLGSPGDRFEREADRVADRIVSGETAPEVQRMCADCAAEEEQLQRQPLEEEKEELQRQPLGEDEIEEEQAVQTRLRSDAGGSSAAADSPGRSSRLASGLTDLRGGGEPLHRAERAFFEPRVGHDLSAVRLHTGPRAAELAASIHARAFTVGHDIVFGAAEYAPAEREGRRLLAHELTHVLQQGGGPPVARRSVAFDAPTEDPRNPAGRILRDEPTGLTTPTVDGSELPDDYIKAGEAVFKALTPRSFGYNAASQECRFADHDASLSANVILPTKPSKGGWSTGIPGTDIKGGAAVAAACGGQKSVPVTMKGKPDHQTVFDWVGSNEQEHLDDLEKAHQNHLEPYFTDILAMRATDADQNKCLEKLMAQLGKKDGLAAKAFIDEWIAAIKARDDKGGHKLKNEIRVKKGCSSIKITSRTR
jgi:hypothetical protein